MQWELMEARFIQPFVPTVSFFKLRQCPQSQLPFFTDLSTKLEGKFN